MKRDEENEGVGFKEKETKQVLLTYIYGVPSI